MSIPRAVLTPSPDTTSDGLTCLVSSVSSLVTLLAENHINSGLCKLRMGHNYAITDTSIQKTRPNAHLLDILMHYNITILQTLPNICL